MDERQQFRKYLLGTLPEQEAAVLDERLFASAEVLHDLEDEQQLLTEDYARGILSEDEEASFYRQLARSPQLSSQAAETQTLFAALRQRARKTQAAARLSLRERLLWILSPALAAALCLVMFLYLNQRHVNTALRAQQEAVSSAPAPLPVPQGRQLVFFLAANVVRGHASLPAITLPATAGTVELQVEIRGNQPATNWSMTISEGSNPVWMSARVLLKKVGSQAFLDAHLETGLLRPGMYTIRIASSQNPQIIQSRQFVVVQGK